MRDCRLSGKTETDRDIHFVECCELFSTRGVEDLELCGAVSNLRKRRRIAAYPKGFPVDLNFALILLCYCTI